MKILVFLLDIRKKHIFLKLEKLLNSLSSAKRKKTDDPDCQLFVVPCPGMEVCRPTKRGEDPDKSEPN